MRRMRPVIDAMKSAVESYDGVVNKVTGDGIMALFGAPRPHEDHAVRACAAALAMQASIAELGDPDLKIRVGIHTGEVVVQAVENSLYQTYDVAGSAAHLAARMEQMAEPGEILLDRRYGGGHPPVRRGHLARSTGGSRSVGAGRGFQAAARQACPGERDFPQPASSQPADRPQGAVRRPPGRTGEHRRGRGARSRCRRRGGIRQEPALFRVRRELPQTRHPRLRNAGDGPRTRHALSAGPRVAARSISASSRPSRPTKRGAGWPRRSAACPALKKRFRCCWIFWV